MKSWNASITAAAACGVVAGWGVVAAWWTPRGPLTGTQALVSLGISAAVGWLAGRLVRSRWTLLAAPVVFWTAMELSRTGIRGPSVDAFHPSPFGAIALVTGRGVHAMLTVAPMVLAVAYARSPQRARWLPVVLTVPVLATAVAVAVPARTSPIAGGVAELTDVDVGGYRLNVMIRGASAHLPVLLFVPGAPGGSELGAMRRHLSGLERHFIVATLDRRGGAGSYPALDPASTLTLDSTVRDIGAVADYLRRRFGQQQIYLLGHSGGSIPAVLEAQRHPERYRAYIGSGQAVDLPASDRIFYTDILTWARTTGRADLEKRLVEQGPPPYRDVYAYEPIMTFENEVYAQSPGAFVIDVPEYTVLEKAHTLTAILDTWTALYPRMQTTDLRTQVSRLTIPAYFVEGTNEMRGLAVLFNDWYARLQAPAKHLQTFPGAGHRAMFEQPDRFISALTTVLADTTTTRPGR